MSAPTFAHGQMRLYLLSLLTDSPKHGYELMQSIEQRFNGTYVPSAGTIYPRLAKLAEDGLASKRIEGRKTMYAITDAGKAELAQRADELQALEHDIDASLTNRAASDDAQAEADALRASIRRSMNSMRRTMERPDLRPDKFPFPANGTAAQTNDVDGAGQGRADDSSGSTADVSTRSTPASAASAGNVPASAHPDTGARDDNVSLDGNGSPIAAVSEAGCRYDRAMAVIDEFRDTAHATLARARSDDRISATSLEVLSISLKRALEDLNRTL